MKPETFNRLHQLRMENDAAGYAMAEMAPRFQQLKDRHENGTAPVAVVVDQLFQTPPSIACSLVSLLNLQQGKRVLEPSAGLGNILDALEPYFPSEVVAVDIAPACTEQLYKQNRVGVTIKQRDFLSLTSADLGTFDAVAMNPPFHMRSDIRHIKHALSFLRPGGRLAAICMDGPHRQAELQPLADSWEELPEGTFAGTGVRTVLLTITK